ncbi:hypothetical protein TNCV_4050531 [Trichonephila clavipes]|nr:hypothetical protein TNCV_4050531 [Trichonephila clavipes]
MYVWSGHYPRIHFPQLIENGFNLWNFRKKKQHDQKAYKLPLPTSAHIPAETSKQPLEENSWPYSKRPFLVD